MMWQNVNYKNKKTSNQNFNDFVANLTTILKTHFLGIATTSLGDGNLGPFIVWLKKFLLLFKILHCQLVV